MTTEEEQKTFLTQGLDEAGVSVGGRSSSSSSAHDDASSAALRLHAKAEELRVLDEQYAAHALRYAERMRRVREGEAAYADKRAHTVAYLRRFKAFIAETDTKRLRAEKKEAEERRCREDKERELQALHHQLRRALRRRAVVQRRAAVYRAYRAYLESVLLHSEQYTDVDELLTRHAILTQTQSDLAEQSAATNARLEREQQQQQAAIKHKQNVRPQPRHRRTASSTRTAQPKPPQR